MTRPGRCPSMRSCSGRIDSEGSLTAPCRYRPPPYCGGGRQLCSRCPYASFCPAAGTAAAWSASMAHSRLRLRRSSSVSTPQHAPSSSVLLLKISAGQNPIFRPAGFTPEAGASRRKRASAALRHRRLQARQACRQPLKLRRRRREARRRRRHEQSKSRVFWLCDLRAFCDSKSDMTPE